MKWNVLGIGLLVSALVACGEGAADGPATESSGAVSSKTAEVVDTVKDTTQAAARRIGEVFKGVVPVLEEALDKQEVHDSLPEKTYTWQEDQKSNRDEIDQLLTEALRILDTSLAQDVRQEIRDFERSIREGQRNLTEYRQKRVSAPTQAEVSLMEKVNPFVVSKEGYDEKIEEENGKIARARNSIASLKDELLRELQAIGLEADGEQVDVLLDSVTGDDQISMAVVFDNIRRIAVELENITEESGEALESARRYYGMYVVLLQVLDLSQRTIVEKIDGQHIPKLRQYADQARLNIETAQALISGGDGDAEVLQQNIETNRVTAEVIRLYVDHLEMHSSMILAENQALQKLINTSENTFETVKLSANVARLIQSTKRDLAAITRLRIPPLRGFTNEVMRKEFRRLTEALHGTG
jgi:hypothetical protein